jgi:hypothetical protein
MNKWLMISLFAGVVGSHGAELHGVSTGVRAGTSLNRRSESFRQVEATLDFDLPWRWQLGPDFKLQSRLDLSAGWLHGEGKDAAVGTAGPSAILSWRDFPVSLDLGSSPTLISRHRFERRDYGSHFQFTSHAGLNWDVARHFRVGYRYQHMSNAGLGHPNPGVNLHMLAVGYRF